jgi:hypothetical protein
MSYLRDLSIDGVRNGKICPWNDGNKIPKAVELGEGSRYLHKQ